MRRPRRAETHTLAGAYALDAVTGADRARFERHLARCQACAQELRELREATARLAGAVAADPPPALVERAVAAAARTTQWPPDTGRPTAWPRSWRARPAGRAGRAPGPGRSWRRRLALGLAAAFLAAAAASGGIALTAAHHLGAAQRSELAVTEVLNAPDAVLLSARVRAGGTVTVVMSHRDRALVFTTAGLPPLPAGRCYQLWLMGPSGDRPVSVLPAPDHGMTSPVIATGLAAGDRVGLTAGPASMTRHLVSTPILMLSLTA